jgi:exopolyphosphatase/guanosine-5'-triphosphate,3'-diphosphate pyrophosphatase
MTERCLHADPPIADEVAEARAVVRERLAEALAVVPVQQARTWVGVAGTFTTIAALAHGLTTYDSEAIHLSRVGFSELLAVCEQLIGMTRQQRATLGPMHEGRVDVIGGGGPESARSSSASTTSSTGSPCPSRSHSGDPVVTRG